MGTGHKMKKANHKGNLRFQILFVLAMVALFSFAARESKAKGGVTIKTQNTIELKSDKKAEVPYHEQVRQQIQKNKKFTNLCYKNLLRKNAKAYGRVEIEWDIHDDARVADVKILRDDLQDKTFATCMALNIKRIKFPAAKKNEVARIVYPFVFTAN